MKMDPMGGDSGTASQDKGLGLFTQILDDPGRTPLPNLAADLDLSRSTLYRICKVLERAGLIIRVSCGHYDVGLLLAEKLPGYCFIA
jgi:DNA-binding IclR family transcriptional regulator